MDGLSNKFDWVDTGLWCRPLPPGRVGSEGRRDDGELQPWHYISVYSIERRLIMRNESEEKPKILVPGALLKTHAPCLAQLVSPQGARLNSFCLSEFEALGV